jgi:hypothetical protein
MRLPRPGLRRPAARRHPGDRRPGAAGLRGLPHLGAPRLPGRPDGAVRRRRRPERGPRPAAPPLRRPSRLRRLRRLRDRHRLRRARPLGPGGRRMAPRPRHRARRVLRAGALRDERHGAPGDGHRPAGGLRGHRGDEPLHLRAGGLPAPRPQAAGGGAQVLPPGRLLLGAAPLRGGPGLRGHRVDPVLGGGRRGRVAAPGGRAGAGRGRPRLQGGGGALPAGRPTSTRGPRPR